MSPQLKYFQVWVITYKYDSVCISEVYKWAMFRTEAMSRAVVFAFVALGAAQLCHGTVFCFIAFRNYVITSFKQFLSWIYRIIWIMLLQSGGTYFWIHFPELWMYILKVGNVKIKLLKKANKSTNNNDFWN